MKPLVALIIFSFSILISCYTYDNEYEISKQNQYFTYDLKTNVTYFKFNAPDPVNRRMEIQFMISHPYKFLTTFNKYKEESKEEDSSNSLFQFSLRKLSEDYEKNDTSIIISGENSLGESRLVLKIDKPMKIVMAVFKKSGDEKELVGKISVKYKTSIQEEKPKYNIYDNRIIFEQNKKKLKIVFRGLDLGAENSNFQNLKISYKIQIFDKSALSKYENIYMYRFSEDVKALYTKEITKENEKVKEENKIDITAELNDIKEQILIIDAEVTDGVGVKEFLQYEAVQFRVEEVATDEVGEGDENNIKKNKLILLIIALCFVGTILLTFVLVFIYIKFCGKKEDTIEEDSDYKNVGGQQKDKDAEINTDEGRINDEE